MNSLKSILNRHPHHEGRYIAEIGLNHNGDHDVALKMIEAAAEAGADGVKFQTIIPEELVSPYGKALLEEGRESFRDNETEDFFRQFLFTREEYLSLAIRARECGVVFFSSPFSEKSVIFLEEVGVPLYKIASSEVTNLSLIRAIGQTGKPCIISTGMAREREISTAIEEYRKAGGSENLLLHCVSNYPLEFHNANLKRIEELRQTFKSEIGFSDHSRGSGLMQLAAVLGARVFEKHFTIDRSYPCPDKEVSVTPEDFSSLIVEVEGAIAAAGDGTIDFGVPEAEIARGARRSLFARHDIRQGAIIREADLIALRPGIGISPDNIDAVAGKTAAVDIAKDMLIRDEYIQKGDSGE